MNMDTLPYPNYDDFFAQLGGAELKVTEAPRLLFETARGCWWGAKKHCTFCGLNGSTMTFRSKSASRAIAELSSLTARYPNLPISVVDNILDMKYFKDFIPALIERELRLDLFYEIKANLSKEQLKLLHDAGIHDVQPGIESLSTNVLALMRKGVTSLQNVQLLKWCKELGLRPYWNIIWGFPGEEPSDYSDLAALVKLIEHLTPPLGASQIRLDRFSPNFDQAADFGFRDVRPYPAYKHIYPLPESVVSNLAYYFTFGYVQPQPVDRYTQALAIQVDEWRQVHSSSDLFYIDKGGVLLVCDVRRVSQRALHVLTGLPRILYLAWDAVHGVQYMCDLVGTQTGRQHSRGEIQEVADRLVEQQLMVREGERYLSLAVRLGNYAPSSLVLNRLKEVVGKDTCALVDESSIGPQYGKHSVNLVFR
jgi:ribosomal peptide maturation radical SAM protein 1